MKIGDNRILNMATIETNVAFTFGGWYHSILQLFGFQIIGYLLEHVAT